MFFFITSIFVSVFVLALNNFSLYDQTVLDIRLQNGLTVTSKITKYTPYGKILIPDTYLQDKEQTEYTSENSTSEIDYYFDVTLELNGFDVGTDIYLKIQEDIKIVEFGQEIAIGSDKYDFSKSCTIKIYEPKKYDPEKNKICDLKTNQQEEEWEEFNPYKIINKWEKYDEKNPPMIYKYDKNKPPQKDDKVTYKLKANFKYHKLPEFKEKDPQDTTNLDFQLYFDIKCTPVYKEGEEFKEFYDPENKPKLSQEQSIKLANQKTQDRSNLNTNTSNHHSNPKKQTFLAILLPPF
ncbi:Hypothetical Protein SLY_1117 [Strawberry lethal yellows phytoplasma (CPA) str. NZSb11]|uniref:Uncharacterized protein n=1 Tax=Strawberry lethal yellows phytoplasma (CPA) str. NZSb11 TaxID=980422 RepID=R4S2K2_PHYAS|nr:Hypothetical Protein SLY_1117 [Strawberry lethal yellows phytoplasma (CPA) str. NZSb11]